MNTQAKAGSGSCKGSSSAVLYTTLLASYLRLEGLLVGHHVAHDLRVEVDDGGHGYAVAHDEHDGHEDADVVRVREVVEGAAGEEALCGSTRHRHLRNLLLRQPTGALVCAACLVRAGGSSAATCGLAYPSLSRR